MVSKLLALSFLSMNAPLDDNAAVEFRYSGKLTQRVRGASDRQVKQFSLYCLARPGANGRRVAFVVDEQGGGGWAWPERYGQVELKPNGEPRNTARPRLLHTHDETFYPLSLPQPLFEFASSVKGKTWAEGRIQYRVAGSSKVKGRECREVELSNNFGRLGSIFYEEDSGIVVKFERRIFMGRGDQFTLEMELESAKPLSAAQLSKIQPPLDGLLQLQLDLKRPERSTGPQLAEAQIAIALAVVETVEKQAESTPLSQLASTIRRDTLAQSRRSDDVGTLVKKFVGRKAPALELTSLTGKPIAATDFAGKTIVLHFWDYQGKLTEPYGQVGYLDFMMNQNKKRRIDQHVKVYGVAVDERLGKPKEATATKRAIRQFREFMNLSYDIAVDDGTLLRDFGDPRQLNAKLPLWVVIGADGKVAHYKVGFYSIKPEEGLKSLEAAVHEQVRKQRAQK